MDLNDAQAFLVGLRDDTTAHFQKLPGSAILLRYIKSSYQDDPVRSAVELFLFLFAVRYLLAPKYSTQKQNRAALTEDEIDELVEDWTPEPLVAPSTALEEAENERRPVIVGPTGPKSKLSNGRTVTNLASYNFYNFVTNDTIKDRAIATLRTYGVGPCGPPGFYGTQDVHMKTEANVAAHLGTAACIVYAQAFSVVSSVIPAFSKRGDVIVVDKAVNYSVRKGIQVSRSTIRWYEHNDVEDLERVLEKVTREMRNKPLTRRFIVTEALFENVGDMVDLPKLIDLKSKYKFRLILDESISYGVLGRTGRGLTEHQHVDPTSVDMIIGSLAGPLSAGGGFCAGSDEVVEHQRLSAAAYTFSAALPAMLATTASETIAMLQESGSGEKSLLEGLKERIDWIRAQLDPRSEWVRCQSAPENPVMLLVLREEVVANKGWGSEEQEWVLQDVVDECLANNVLITRLKAMPVAVGATPKERGWQPQPALKVCITIGLSRKEIERAGVIIRHAITKVVKSRK